MRDRALDILFEPLETPNLTFKNRFFMAPMGTTFTGQQLTDYLVARARGDIGCITTGVIRVHPSGSAHGSHEPSLEKDSDIEALSPMVKVVQEAGARIIAQLNHTGRYSFGRYTGQQSVAPSPIASRYTGETPRELTTQETDDLVVAFAEAGVRAQKTGFDGIELCACSGYLISQFLSAVTNKREDKYGGSDICQRATFLFSILQETRRLVGKDFNICVKFDADDGMEGGKSLEDSLILAPRIVEAGTDRLHIWAGWHESTRPMLPMFVQRGAFSYMSKAIKDVVDVPVSTVGRINDPYVAADILERGDADLIGLARALLADPDFVRKTGEGRVNEIRKCTACCYCFDQMMNLIMKGDTEAELKCAINPELGHEGERLIQPAEQKKKIVVIGGGPAGTELARVAALRGHEVTLYEKAEKPGGLVRVAAVPPNKEELRNIIDYYETQMGILPVDIRMKEVFTKDKVREICPEVVVAATGADELIPDIPGIQGENVVTAVDVLKGKASVGYTVVVIGGGMVGVETAEYLAEQHKKVTVVEMLKSVANDVGPSMRWGLLSRIYQKVTILTLTKVIEVNDNAVIVIDKEGTRSQIPADTIVLAAGMTVGEDLCTAMKQEDVDCYKIGSCSKPGQIAEAISSAFFLGCKL